MRPLVDGVRVRWIGTVGSLERNALVASARFSLFPLQWEEPGGTAVVESLALGTPVVGLPRGCLPELVKHGRTGWLATSPDGLAALVQAAERIDARECREQAARRFTPAVMAARYAELYEQVISGTSGKPAYAEGILGPLRTNLNESGRCEMLQYRFSACSAPISPNRRPAD